MMIPSDARRKKIILAIDDVPENLDVIKSAVAPEYTAKCVTSGALGLKIAALQPPDLILLDVIMPDLDGYDVCRQLKADAATRDIPVIFVTTQDQIEDETSGLSLGAVDYVTKPIHAPILRARIATQLTLAETLKGLAHQNQSLVAAARLHEDVEHITRHDLKSPLSVIIGVPDLLLSECDFTAQQRAFVISIRDAGYRILSMINCSLDIFRMESGTYEFRPVRVDLLSVIQGVLVELETTILTKQLHVRILVDDKPAGPNQKVLALAETLLCHSMFSNLCINAIEASPPEGEVTIRFHTHTDITVSIENSGEVPAHIRETFFGKYITAQKSGGTGLGTYSAMLIATTQGGTITLDTSTAGRTRINVVLKAPESPWPPRIRPEASHRMPALGILGKRGQEFSQQRQRKILVVDDLAHNIEFIATLLSPNYCIIGTTDGLMALQRAASEQPHLILLDIMMPAMDGYEVCRRLKSNPITRDIPIIFITAKNDSEAEALGLALGAVDYILKPIIPAILRARIQTHIALADAIKQYALQNKALVDAAQLRQDVESITRHDLKAPLNTIVGVPQLLLMQCRFTAEQQQFIKQIMESGFRMLEMINRSLDLFKMENGTYQLKPWPVDLVPVIHGVLSELSTAILAKHLRISILIDGHAASDHRPVYLMTESLLCHSMFSNLCKNAIEASPDEDVVTISFERGINTVISIENGGEVPENIRDNFFGKFVTEGKQGGTGLGTYSAMLIARTHGGSISLDTSKAGRTFVAVTLPTRCHE